MFAKITNKKQSSSADAVATSTNIIVIGSGIAGILSALECAKDDKDIFVFEKFSDILNGTSKNQCYRLHTGLHYPDKDFITPVKCLFDTVASMIKLPARCVRVQTSRYYLMSNSLYDQVHMEKTASLISAAYRELVDQDIQNKVLGEPENLVRFVKPEEYQSYTAHQIPFTEKDLTETEVSIVAAIDIIEPQILIDEFRHYLLQKIEETRNIHLCVNHRVTSITQCDDDFGYIVKTVELGVAPIKERIFVCDAIVNSSWEETEHLNPDDFNEHFTGDVINRMKASLLVQLPDVFLAQKIPSSLFCYGPHAALSVLENGTGVMTWEPATNIGSWMPGKEPSDTVNAILRDGVKVTEGFGQDITTRILQGFSRYIPSISGAKPLELRIGYVRTPIKPIEKTEFSIYEKDSSIHLRRASGVEPLIQIFSSCYIINEARKFTYGICNASKVRSLMRAELEHMESWRRLLPSLQRPGHEFRFEQFRTAMNTVNLMLFNALGQIDPNIQPIIIMAMGIMSGGERLMRHQIDTMAKHIGDIQEQQAEEQRILSLVKKFSHQAEVSEETTQRSTTAGADKYLPLHETSPSIELRL